MNIITNPSNQKIKDLVQLRKTGQRLERGLILIDGFRETEIAAASGWQITEIFCCPELAKGKDAEKLAASLKVPDDLVNEVSVEAFKKAAYKENPDGCLALAERREASWDDIDMEKKPLLAVLESVEKPGNLGAIIRTACAAGVEALIINDQQTDIFNPNVIRASEGLIFRLPIIAASAVETSAWLKEKDIKSVAAVTGAREEYTRADLSGALAIVLGSEAYGLSATWQAEADLKVRIPMQAGIDSLNVSVAAAILIYEAVRQRRTDV